MMSLRRANLVSTQASLHNPLLLGCPCSTSAPLQSRQRHEEVLQCRHCLPQCRLRCIWGFRKLAGCDLYQ
jgi:hypothetical protein